MALAPTRARVVLAALACVSPTVLSQTTPQRATVTQSVTVTATDRGLVHLQDAATSVAVISAERLQAAPGFTLDDGLHPVAGFQLFRRTSSWTANPTSQGVSLRGLGSTAASRTLVVSDEVPLNDAFGGWVHWNEIPALAIRSVELLRGGASDLYGSSAIGGVIDVIPEAVSAGPDAASAMRLDLRTAGATENTALGDALLTTAARRISTLAAVSALSTGGYIPTAPSVRGPIDIPANVANQSARLEFRFPVTTHLVTFMRGNLLNETRSNGTPLQTNATRLWRYQMGADYAANQTTAEARVFGSREGYRQTFTSIPAVRATETLSRLQRVPTDELGLVLQASHAFPRTFTAALGFDLRDIRATDDETTPSNGVVTSTSARQRATGGFADALWQPVHWSFSGSVRVDSFRTFNARTLTAALPTLSELVASPRLGVVRNLPGGLSLTATASRSFRGPTLNELYRTSQVGQQLTLANSALLAERATSFELGPELARASLGRIRATYFWTEVNRPISAVQLSQTATTQTLQRQNLGQIRSRGLMLEAASALRHGFDVGFGYQYALATVTAFQSNSAAQADLTGKWIPEVARHSTNATVDFAASHVAVFHAFASYQGREYDDALNTFVLHPYARFDLSADRAVTHSLTVFASAQNVLNRSIDAGRTPLLTLAPPRVVEAGLRYTIARK